MSGSPPDAAAGPAASRFALLDVDGVEYAVESAWVRRTLPAPEPPPAAISHGGADFPLIDLRQLFGLPRAQPQGGSAKAPALSAGLVLLVERPRGADPAGTAASVACRVALMVDDLRGIEPLPAGNAVPLPAVYRGPERRWFKGLLPRAGGRVTVLLRLDGIAPAAAAAATRQEAGAC
jgi:chemotaxis signal transduction protein